MRSSAWLPLTLLLAACQGSEGLERRLAAEPGGRLEVDLYMGEGLRPDQGSLAVLSHDASAVWIAAEATGWGASGVHYRVEQDGDTVRVYGRVTGALSWLFGGPQMTVRIWVPREFSLDLRTSAGPIRVDDVSGAIRIRGGEAPMEVSAVAGSLRVRSTDGDVRVSEAAGEIDVRTGRGSIDLSWLRGHIEARTARGEIRADHVEGSLELTSGRGGIEMREIDGSATARTERGSVFASFVGPPEGVLETSRGSIHVELPEGVGAELEAVSRRGSVELAPGIEVNGRREEGRVAGRLGPGGARLRLLTARGAVHVGHR